MRGRNNSETGHLDPEAVVAVLREEGTVTAASRVLGVKRNTLTSYLNRESINISRGATNASWQGESTKEVVESVDPSEWGDLEKLSESRGLRKDDWRISRARVNRWGGDNGTNEQLRVDLEPIGLLPRPVRSEGWKPPRDAKSRKVTKGLTFITSDHHCPRHDPILHAAAVKLMREVKPEQIVVAGDLIDYAGVSRHRKNGLEAGLNESLQAAYDVLRAYREAVPGAKIVFLDGNHEQRLFNALADKGLVSVGNLTRPGDDTPILSTRHLLRLDELNIEQEFPPEGCSYEHAELRLTKTLAVRHGWISSSGSGSSALKTLDKLRRNVIVGHTHRQSLVAHTHWDIDGNQHRLVAAEAGTMAAIDQTGMDYAIAADWQSGFCSVQEVGDRFTVELAVFQDGLLYWRDRVIG